METRLGEFLLRRGYITSEQFTRAAKEQHQQGGALSAHLVKLGFLTEDDLLSHLQKEYRLPAIEPSTLRLSGITKIKEGITTLEEVTRVTIAG
jgi:type II secretory ATPase GspE/PulE/Tfp pilus assembly ATPase PilB-like protein